MRKVRLQTSSHLLQRSFLLRSQHSHDTFMMTPQPYGKELASMSFLRPELNVTSTTLELIVNAITLGKSADWGPKYDIKSEMVVE